MICTPLITEFPRLLFVNEETTGSQITRLVLEICFLLFFLISELDGAFGNCVTAPPSVCPSNVEWNRTAECQNLGHFSSFPEQAKV